MPTPLLEDALTIAPARGPRRRLLLDDLDAIKRATTKAWAKDLPTVLEIPISPQVPPLI
jgi:hypothetical protein